MSGQLETVGGLLGSIPEWISNDTCLNETAKDNKQGRLALRGNIDSLQNAMQEILGSETGEMEEINANGLNEYLVGGAYIRSLLIPKDTVIVSKIWNKERLWIIASGEVTFTTEAGTRRVKAPYVEQPVLGSKTAIMAHEDTLWFAVTGAGAQNLGDVESELIAKDYSDIKYPWDMIDLKGDMV